ncbi:MAG TPA: SH3 domain-containing protein [Anaerolineales bacterium]|jgi:multiple sugar transport system permease protein|nr:SH3 domain-containing protein [Anaerolineales bacterium]
MTTATKAKGQRNINWAPYILILPSFIYLILFFGWPMIQGLILAVREERALLTLRTDAERNSPAVGQLPRGTQVDILGQQGNQIPPEEAGQDNLLTEVWFQVRAESSDGQPLEGWTPERRIRVRESNANGAPIAGTVRSILSSSADPLTSVYAEADEGSDVVGKLEARAPVEILGQATLEVWFQVKGQNGSETIEGWMPARYLNVLGDGSRGRIEEGDTSQFTTKYIQSMVNDRFFWPALRTTLLLIVLIIPAQFVLAIIMALVIQADLKGSGLFLYVFSIALGVSDLAVGILWYSIFTQSGYLNSILQGLGLIDAPIIYLSADTRYWILIAIWLAEMWRATAIVMVIVVAGMQAISREVLEAAEVFGATLWQRIRYVILPLLRPSLQVALILRTILAFQVFAVVIVMSGGDIITVLANETYRQYYELRNFNVAAAYASFILLLSMITSMFYLRAVRTQEEVAE